MERKHVLLLTFPAYGHIIPLLGFGKKVSQFHDVTFALSADLIEQLRQREIITEDEHVQFYGVPDGYSANTIMEPNDVKAFEKLRDKVHSGIQKLVASLTVRGKTPSECQGDGIKPVDVVILDTTVSAAGIAAGCDEKGIPYYLFVSSSIGSSEASVLLLCFIPSDLIDAIFFARIPHRRLLQNIYKSN